MQFIEETSNKEVSFLLHPLNYTQLYNKLRSALSPSDMQLFARPDVLPGSTSWSATSSVTGKVISFSMLSDAEKDELADKIELLKNSIFDQLAGSKDFVTILPHLFTVPGETNIKAIYQDNSLQPIFTQWACTSALVKSNIDPLSTFLMRPRLNSDIVSVEFSYHTGQPATELPFRVIYNGSEAAAKTDTAGVYHRGRCKLGSILEVIYEKYGSQTYRQVIEVVKNGQYKVVLPLLAPVNIVVTDQYGDKVAKMNIGFKQGDTNIIFETDENGCFSPGELKVGDEFVLSDMMDKAITASFSTRDEQNDFVFKVHRIRFGECIITVTDEKGLLYKEYGIQVKDKGNEKGFFTNEKGVVYIGAYAEETVLLVSSKANGGVKSEYTVKNEKNEWVFVVPREQVKFVKIRLIDSKKNPLTNVKMDLTIGGKKQAVETNEEGFCIVPYSDFKDKEKVKAFIHATWKGKNELIKR